MAMSRNIYCQRIAGKFVDKLEKALTLNIGKEDLLTEKYMLQEILINSYVTYDKLNDQCELNPFDIALLRARAHAADILTAAINQVRDMTLAIFKIQTTTQQTMDLGYYLEVCERAFALAQDHIPEQRQEMFLDALQQEFKTVDAEQQITTKRTPEWIDATTKLMIESVPDTDDGKTQVA